MMQALNAERKKKFMSIFAASNWFAAAIQPQNNHVNCIEAESL
jgi:hypothetical protein